MEKVSIKNLIEFRGKTGSWKKRFVKKLFTPKPKKLEGSNPSTGGNYWQFSIWAIVNSFKADDLQIIKDKIVEVEEKLNDNDYSQKGMCRDNIAALRNFESFKFRKWRLSGEVSFLKHPTSILNIRDIPIKVTPHCIFVNEDKEMGAIWLIGQKKGFSDGERGMYVDALYRGLKEMYSDDYTINPEYCLAVDIVNNKTISYAQLQQGDFPKLLRSTINEIVKLL